MGEVVLGVLGGREVASFASRMHWDHEPIRFGPRAVPARSGRARTRASVIFQGCWRGPHAATGDRSRSSGSTGQFTGQWQVHGETGALRLLRRPAAVDEEIRAGNIAGIFGAEIDS